MLDRIKVMKERMRPDQVEVNSRRVSTSDSFDLVDLKELLNKTFKVWRKCFRNVQII